MTIHRTTEPKAMEVFNAFYQLGGTATIPEIMRILPINLGMDRDMVEKVIENKIPKYIKRVNFREPKPRIYQLRQKVIEYLRDKNDGDKLE